MRPSPPALGFTSIVPIPMSARYGDNIIERSANTAWYHGPCLLDYLESIDVAIGDGRPAVPLSRAMGEPAQSRLPRLCRHRGVRQHRRRATRSWWRPPGARSRDQPHRDIRRRPGGGGSRRCRDDDAGRRNRCRPRRYAGEADRAARCRRPVRRASDLDGPGPAGPGPLLHLPDRDAVGRRRASPRSSTASTSTPASTSRRTTLGLNEIGFCNVATALAGRLRSLRGQPQDRLVHRDRSLHQPDRRRRA